MDGGVIWRSEALCARLSLREQYQEPQEETGVQPTAYCPRVYPRPAARFWPRDWKQR